MPRIGEGDSPALYCWSRHWMEAEHEAADSKTARVASVRAHLARLLSLNQRFHASLAARDIDKDEADDLVNEAEFRLARAEAE